MKQLMIGCLALTACGTYEENLGRTRDASARWAITLGTHEDEVARNAAIDSIGDVVAVGYQEQSLRHFAGFVTKRVASDGSERWTTRFVPLTTDSHADTMSVVIAPGDAMLVGGGFQGRVDFAGSTLDASNPTPADGGAGFVAKLSSGGQVEWVRMLQNVGVQAITVGPDGRSYLTGGFIGPLTVAGEVLSSSSTDNGAVLIALDPAGVPLWGRTFISVSANDGGARGESVTIALNGDVLVVGQFLRATRFGGPVVQLAPGSRSGAFLTRFRSDGLYLASSVVPAPGWELSVGLAVTLDPTGATVVSTAEQNPADGNAVPFVHVLDDAQQQLWTTEVHGPIAFTSDGAMLTAQWRDVSAATPTGALELATVDANGFSWTTSLGSRTVYAPRLTSITAGAAAGPDGGVVFVGALTGTLNIAGTDLEAVGGQQDDSDALVIMIDP